MYTVNKPSRADKQRKAAQFEKDASGRMIVNEEEGGHEDGAESTNAYLEAVAGEDGFHRTAKGAVKANKGRKRSRQEEDDDRLAFSL